jgi:hypothetical protein
LWIRLNNNLITARKRAGIGREPLHKWRQLRLRPAHKRAANDHQKCSDKGYRAKAEMAPSAREQESHETNP